MNVIELRGVTAGYDGVTAIRDVSLTVGEGEMVALVGANGAGKTTTIRAACGLSRIEQGAVLLLREDVTALSPRARARIGLGTVSEDRGVFTQLTVAENLDVGRGGIRGRPSLEIESWFPYLLPFLGRRAGLLSGGEQTMLALARAMVSRPRALVVDELTTGLAPAYAAAALAILRRAAEEWGAGVLFAEQSAHLALETADRACLLRRGQVLLDGAPQEIAGRPGVLESTYLGEPG